MIIGHYGTVDFAIFQAGLERAARGVVRVFTSAGKEKSGQQAVCTGWLITDELVVVPDYVVQRENEEPSDDYTCEQGSQIITANTVLLASEGRPGSAPALLRLAEPLRDRSLPLASIATELGDQIFILQHPRGRQRLGLSFGELIAMEEPWLRYDADTEPGSGGAPVLASSGIVVAMHVSRSSAPDPDYNQGISLKAMLGVLRKSAVWDEIANHHGLADVDAIRTALNEPKQMEAAAAQNTELVRAALSWSFDPATFSDDAVERLRPLVPEPNALRWMLPSSARASLLKSAGSLEALRQARGAEAVDHPGQQVIDRILQGPPYSLDEVPERALPYWLQVTRWFAGLVPSLPSSTEVNRALERKRIRSRLMEIGGTSFRGRGDQLDNLHAWYGAPLARPMVITGIGGMGKSALVARFALDLPEDTIHVWLDFDRADLAPDDPASVLRLLSQQLATQLEGFQVPSVDPTSWSSTLSGLGSAFASHLDRTSDPLLVLDGFEVAQHVREHREIWQMLERLLPQIPGLRVLVSGRAPVDNLELGGRPAQRIELLGLSEPDAKKWLNEAGIVDEQVLERVVKITRGIPLALRLAIRWVETGGEICELPAELPEHLVHGFLYERILDRVMDQRLKPVAQDALVLRRIAPAMIPAIVSDNLPEGFDAEEVFSRLTQEMALVGDEMDFQMLESPMAPASKNVLRLRPEVRSATLRLLEIDRPERVRTIDRRAAAWYSQQDPDHVVNAAELVYHRLRLGDVEGAEAAWRDGCAALLLHADEELPADEPAARIWLRDRTYIAPTETDVHAAWEDEAHDRIRSLIARGVLRSVAPLLDERTNRSSASPLVLYDAWLRWALNDDIAGARQTLLSAGKAEGLVGRDRAVLAAWLAAEAGDRREADHQLLEIAGAECWTDRSDPELEALTVEAARIRLTIDTKTELKLADMLIDRSMDQMSLGNIPLVPSDVIAPFLADQLGGTELEATNERLLIPIRTSQLDMFAHELDRMRGFSRGGKKLTLSETGDGDRSDVDPWRWHELGFAETLIETNAAGSLAGDLAVLGRRRWRLVGQSLFLAKAIELALARDVNRPQRLSILGTLAAFATNKHGSFVLAHKTKGPLYRLPTMVDINFLHSISPKLPPRRSLLAKTFMLRLGVSDAESMDIDRIAKSTDDGVANLILHLLSPDPLEMLMRRIIGIPDTLSVRGQS